MSKDDYIYDNHPLLKDILEIITSRRVGADDLVSFGFNVTLISDTQCAIRMTNEN